VIVIQLKGESLPDRQPSSYQPSELGPYERNRTLPYIAAVLHLQANQDRSFVLGDDLEYSIPTQGKRRRNMDGESCYCISYGQLSKLEGVQDQT
jgi:hypothetical protein